MKIHTPAAVWVLAVACLTSTPATLRAQQAPPPASATSLQADLLKDWQSLKDTMVKIAEAMPPDKVDFNM